MTDAAPQETLPALNVSNVPTLQALASLTCIEARRMGILDWSGDGVPHALLSLHAHISAVRGQKGKSKTRALAALTRAALDLAECVSPGLLLHLIEQTYPDAVLTGGTTLTSLGTVDATQDLLDWHGLTSLSAATWYPEDQPTAEGQQRPTVVDVLLPLAKLLASVARALALNGQDAQAAVVASFN